MLEVDIDDSGTVDFFEFLCVARLIAQGKGRYKASDRKNKRTYHSYLKFVLRAHRERVCYYLRIAFHSEKFENGFFHSENASNVFRPHYAGGI